MRLVGSLAILALCVTLTGCSLFDKKPAPQAKANPNAAPDRPFWQEPSAGTAAGPSAPAIADRTAPSQGRPGGILAGQVTDSYNHRPPPTLIQVICTDDKQTTGAPIDVAADSQGYFTIQGLQPGKHYQLIARAKDGDHVLAGSTQVTPPNPRILIRMSEDLVGANANSGTGPIKPSIAAPSGDRPAPDWTPPPNNTSANPPAGVEILPPSRNPRPNANVRPQDMADGSAQVGVFVPPQGNVPNGADGSARRGATWPADTAPSGAFCKLTGDRLENFGLKDVNGQTWEFRKDHRGRVILLDFWGTWCMPCREAIWHLNSLNNVYRDYGLEIVGIAEEQGDAADHARKVNSIRQRQGINYRLLLGGGVDNPCPVRTEFGIQRYPTLVLLDDTGRILWRAEGLDDAKLRELQGIIRQQLRIRDYP